MPATRHPPRPVPIRTLAALLFLLLGGLAGVLAAQEGATDPVGIAQSTYEQIVARSGAEALEALDDLEEISGLIDELERVRQVASRCVQETSGLLERLGRKEAAVTARPGGPSAAADAAPVGGGAAPAPDAPSGATATTPGVATILSDLTAQRGRLDARLALCRLLELNSSDLGARLLRREQALATSALLTREPDVLEVLRQNAQRLHEWPRAGQALLRLVTGIEELGWRHFLGLAAVALGAVLLGLGWRRRPLRHAPPDGEPLPFTTNLLFAARAVARSFAPPLFGLLAINGYLAVLLLHEAAGISTTLALGALLLLLLAMLARLLLDPPKPASPLLAVREGIARKMSRRLQVFTLLVLVALLLIELRDQQVLDHVMLLLLADAYVLLLALNVLALISLAGKGGTARDRFLKRLLPGFVVLVILAATWLGYRTLARLIFQGTVGSVIALYGVLLASRLIDDLHDSFDEGRYGWQRGIRRAVGLGSDEHVPGLGWLALLLQIALWGLFAVLVMHAWGVPPQVIDNLGRLLVEGFEVGSVAIVPSRLLWAILTLFLLLMAVRWIQVHLEKRWLLRTRMERGAREAVATSVGYGGIALAIMLSLSMAGIDFTNLALIAGALSVGIGFGLQNVVNNFISGLIMLFERPVKTGDWIVVGATEGYVRRISIRTTTIETFDRAEVIVPNSELISNQVTNWMHNNNYGRFKVPIGVAYGSDTEKVRELLLQVARDHPQVVTGFPSWPDPWVLFIGFGDSALNFELRGIIYNVDSRLRVISDLNFAIDRAFREHGIEIPFPQRVVHLAGASEPPGTSGEQRQSDT